MSFAYSSSDSNGSLDSPTQKPSEYFPCSHSSTVKHKDRLNCFSCGLFIHDDVKAYKTQRMRYGTYFDPSRYYTSAIKQRMPKITILPDSDFQKNRSSLLSLIWETSEKLRLSPNTTHLAVVFMDLVLSRVTSIPVQQYKVYAVTSIMLAAKSVELDERIPFISKLQRYSGLVAYKSKDFSAAEQIILREINWNLQCLTAIDVIEYYLTQGVVFSTDCILEETYCASTDDNPLQEKSNFNDSTPLHGQTNRSSKYFDQSKPNDENKDFLSSFTQLSLREKENNGIISSISSQNKKNRLISDLSDQRVHSILSKIEKDYIRLSNLLIKDYRFYEFETKTLSAACICFLRKASGLSSSWTKELDTISNNQVNEKSVSECLNIMESKYFQLFVPLVNQNTKRPNTALIRDYYDNQNINPSLLSSQQSSISQRLMSKNNLCGSTEKSPSKQLTVLKPILNSNEQLQFHASQMLNNSNGVYVNNAAKLIASSSSSSPLDQVSNPVLANKTNFHNYLFTTSTTTTTTTTASQLPSSNQNINQFTAGAAPLTSQTNSSYFRTSSQSYQHNNYIGLMRFGSTIL